MLDRWYQRLDFAVPIETFERLPEHPAFKYEYWDGEAHLTPRPKIYHALLEVAPRPIPETARIPFGEEITTRGFEAHDWDELPELMGFAFHRMPPFGQLGKEDRVKAARDCLAHTRNGGDGAFVPAASFVAGAGGEAIGAILITIQYAGNLETFDDPYWNKPVPADAWERRWGRPHITWAFVNPWCARHGIGSALLAHSVNALHAHGYRELASTFQLGNDSSTLWHWSNGFRLLSYLVSPRNYKRREQTAGGAEGRQPSPLEATDAAP